MGVQCQTRFNTQLNGAITSIQTTATLDAAPAQTTGYGTFERGNANEEDVYWAGLAGLQLTGMLRGLSRTALTNTEVVGNQYAHVDNSAFEGTLLHYIVNNKVDVDDNEAITGSWTFNTQLPTSTDTPGANAELTTKIYVDTADNLKGNLSGGNVWAGTQTFADDAARSTTNAAPVTATAFTNKQYVDDQIATTANNRVAVSSNDTTPGFLLGKLTGNTHITFTEINDAGDEDLRINTDAIQSTAGAANANALIATDANGRLDRTFTALPMTAAEAVTAGNAVALLPLEVEYFSQLTDANLALGDSNVRRRYAVRITPSVTTSSLTTMIFRAAEAVNASTTLGNLNISIQTDNAGEPSGTIITNGSANAITQVTQRTWNTTQADRTATWAAAPTLTAGTTYWIAFAVSATDAVNFLNLSVNSSHDENYVTFTRLTFNLDAGTWGGSAINATPFFWFNNQPKLLGAGVVPTDANWGARTWNFIGFARTTVAANAAVDVYHDIAPNQTGLRPGLDYYLDNDPVGGIQLTAPGGFYQDTTEPTLFSYRIGKAISTTTLKINTGSKCVWGTVQDSAGSASVVNNFVLWFLPTYVQIDGGYAENAANITTVSYGIYNGTNNHNVAFLAETNISERNLADSLGDGAGSEANRYEGSGSAITDIGFTYTLTETGGVDAVGYRFIATQ